MQIGTSQFGSDLIALEELHLLKLGVWAALSILIGSALVAFVRLRRSESPLLQHFGIQCAAWGAVDLLIVWWAGRGVEIRDLAGAIELDRFVWLNIGLDIGYVLGMAALLEGDAAAARAEFQGVIDNTQWIMFGHIAAEAELARLSGR